MDNILVPSVSDSECKYLSTIISQKNCDQDIKRQMNKFYASVICYGDDLGNVRKCYCKMLLT